MIRLAFICDPGFSVAVQNQRFRSLLSQEFHAFPATSLATLASYKSSIGPSVELLVIGCLSEILAGVKVSKVEARAITISKYFLDELNWAYIYFTFVLLILPIVLLLYFTFYLLL